MAFEQLGEPRDYRDAKEFNEFHAPAEGSVIDRLQALWPHGFHVRNTPGMDNRVAVWERNMRRGRHARDRASGQHGIQPQDQALGPSIPPIVTAAAPFSLGLIQNLQKHMCLVILMHSLHMHALHTPYLQCCRVTAWVRSVLISTTHALSISHPVVQHL